MKGENSRTNVAYYGAHKGRNLGDVAIYQAAKNLLPNTNLVDGELIPDSGISLLGGGTVLPYAISSETTAKFSQREKNIVLGAGVAAPEFWNRRIYPCDIRYYAGELGININLLLNNLPPFISDAVNILDSKQEWMNVSGVYLDDNVFNKLENIDFDILTVRGPRSKKILEKYDFNPTIVGDTALALDGTNESTDKKQIAVCISNYSKWMVGKEYDTYNPIVEFCKRFSNEYNFVFVPFNPSDFNINNKAANEIEGAKVLSTSFIPDVAEVLEIFSRSSFVIGERLHANILAAATETPFLSIGYALKHQDFAESIGVSDWNMRRDKLSVSELEDHILSKKRSGMPNSTKNKICEYKKELKSTAEDIYEII